MIGFGRGGRLTLGGKNQHSTNSYKKKRKKKERQM